MKLVDKAKEYLDTGVRVSKDVLVKAGGAVQEMSDKGVLRVEIAQLKSKRKRAHEKLGEAVFEAFIVQETKTLTSKKPEISGVLSEISGLNDTIAAKTKALNEAAARPDSPKPDA
jgi:hypothetical protein